MALTFDHPEAPSYLGDDVIAEISRDPGFGSYFTDHMAVADWNQQTGWHGDRLVDYAPVAMEPAGAVYHYAQSIFEGLKAYRHADGSVWLFRPDANAARFERSAFRLALPQLPAEDFITSVRQLVALDQRWVPGGVEQSLYLRPFMMASENFLGVRPAQSVIYVVIASPVGAYFTSGVAPVDIWVSTQYSRVATGGTGAAKCGGNYAASLLPQELAYEQGCSQVLFVDAAERRWVEELGGMNFFMITADDQLVTPDLNGNILPGVTRDSLLTVAPELGLRPVERPIELAEVLRGIEDGGVRELFACGTAAVITPIRSLKHEGRQYVIDVDKATHTIPLREHLLDIQYGRTPDTRGWMQQVC
ncbi:MAG: branched-chain amino acid aminotransferase [Brooklawnia sp.]|uniref:branched-chain amino acid aminotransferase n=1 Tax=Brooklawnia sp. TaxID=2699740 RepID=UPI003C782127